MDAPATNSSHPPGLLTIAFFGLGAMGSSMLICLSELAERVDVLLRFVVVVLNDDLGREALFDAERLVERINFVEPADFAPLFDGSAPKLERLADVQVLVNAAQPGFNQPLLELGLSLDADVVDLASDMDDTETERSLAFSQYTFDQAYRASGGSAMIKLGISPGVTNLLIGLRLHQLRGSRRRDLVAWDINLCESVRDATPV